MTKKDIVLETLQGLTRNGRIRPEDVVEEARETKSPLHKYFQWDDGLAAQEYRLWQSRQLITYKFKVDGTKEQQYYNVRVVVNKIPTQGYFTKEKVLSSKKMYIQVLKDAIIEIKYWERKYNQIRELGGIVNQDKLKEIEKKLG